MVVKLTAAPDTLTLNVFQGWTGCTAPNGATCTITTTADVSVTAQFATGDTLTVTKTGSSDRHEDIQQPRRHFLPVRLQLRGRDLCRRAGRYALCKHG